MKPAQINSAVLSLFAVQCLNPEQSTDLFHRLHRRLPPLPTKASLVGCSQGRAVSGDKICQSTLQADKIFSKRAVPAKMVFLLFIDIHCRQPSVLFWQQTIAVTIGAQTTLSLIEKALPISKIFYFWIFFNIIFTFSHKFGNKLRRTWDALWTVDYSNSRYFDQIIAHFIIWNR